MLFITGLLTLLALTNAGGDHVKGGGHIKGHPLASASKTIQQQIFQEEVIPSPYNFNIKTGTAYGTKVSREETGDAEGRVKGSYTIDGPRGTSRVVEYLADDSGFHANIKTSEPNIKTHSPSNVQVEVVPKNDISPTALEKAHRSTELHHAAVVPVVQDPVIILDGDLSGTRTKSIKTVVPSGLQTGNVIGDGIIALNRGLIQKQDEAGFSRTFGGVVRTDNLERISLTSSDVQDLSKYIGYGSVEPIQPEPEVKRPDPVKPTVVRTSSQRISDSTRTRVIPGPTRTSGSVSTPQEGNIRFVLGSDLGSAEVKPKAQVVSSLKPKPPIIVQPKVKLSDEIVAINRGLIQKQSEAGLSQTFGSVIQTDGNLQGVSITASELEDLSKRIGYGTRGQPLASPVPIKPVQLKPTVIRTSSQRVTDSARTRVISGSARVSGAAVPSVQGENIQFVLGNDAGSAGVRSRSQAAPDLKPEVPAPVQLQAELGDDIIAINRELIQKQGEAGFSQTFGGVIRTDENLQGVSITASELEDLSKRIGYGTRRQPLASPVPIKPVQLKPAVVRTSSQRVTDSARTRVISGPARVSGAAVPSIQGENIQFVLGNDAGSAGVRSRSQAAAALKPEVPAPVQLQAQLEDDIIAINRELIQKQGEAGFSQTFGGVIRTDGNLDGLSITPSELEDLSKRIRVDTSRQPQAVPVLNKPESVKPAVVRTSAQRVTGSQRTLVIPGSARISGVATSSTQGENIKFVLGTDAGSVGAVKPIKQPALAPKPKAPGIVQPQAQIRNDIVAINRGLIQKQGDSGFTQTFGGIIRTDGNLQGVSITTSELEDLSKRIGYGTRGQPLASPVLKKPVQVKPTVVRTSSQRITDSARTQVVSGPARVSGAAVPTIQGEKIQFVLGNDAGSAGVRSSVQRAPAVKPKVPAPVQLQAQLGDDIIAINRELIQKQSEAGFSQTFGGVINTDGNLDGLSITSSELEDLSKRVRAGSSGQPQAAPELKKLEPVKPTAVRTSSQRVTGSIRTGRPATAIETTEGGNIKFVLGNGAGSVGFGRPGGSQITSAAKPKVPPPVRTQAQLSDGIISINRELIQNQGESGFSQTFGGIIRSDGNLEGISVTSSELEDLSKRLRYGTRGQPLTSPVLKKPDPVKPSVRTPSRVTGSTGTRVIRGPASVTGAAILNQGENIRFVIGNDAGSVGTVRTRVQPIPVVKPIPGPIQSNKQLNDGIIALNRGLIKKQSETGLSGAFGGVIQTDGNLAGVSISSEEFGDLSKRIGQDINKVEARAPLLRKPDRVVNRNAVRQQVRVTSNAAVIPESPQILSAKALNDDIIFLNRGLIDKQGTEGVLQTFRGIAESDTDLDGIAVSLKDIQELSRNIGVGVSAGSESGRGQGISEAEVRTVSGRQSSSIRGPGSRGSQAPAVRQRTGPFAYSATVGGLRSSSGVQQNVNQDRIESQIVQETFESSFSPDSSIQPNQESIIPDFVVVDSPASPPVQKFAEVDGRGQLQLKLDDIVEQSSLPSSGQKASVNPPVQLQVAVEDFNAKYLQEKLPVEISGYVPAPSIMSPSNYRIPGLNSLKVPKVEEQQRLEQVFVV